MNVKQVIIFLGCVSYALLFPWVWIYSYIWFVKVFGEANDAMRFLGSFSSAFIVSLLMILPIKFLHPSVNWLLPTAFSVVIILQFYVVRPALDPERSIILSLVWAFGDIQSVLVIIGFGVAPFLSFGFATLICKKLSQRTLPSSRPS